MAPTCKYIVSPLYGDKSGVVSIFVSLTIPDQNSVLKSSKPGGNGESVNSAQYEIQTAIQYSSKVAYACSENGEKSIAEEINKKLQSYYVKYVGLVRPISNE